MVAGIWYLWIAVVLLASPSTGRTEKSRKNSHYKLVEDADVKDRASLDEYLFKLIESLKNNMHSGIPELDIPNMEPLKISSIVIDQGGGVAKIRAAFQNLEVYGLSNYTTTYAKSEPENYRFTLGLKYHELKIYGDYNISGNLLLVPISGQGTFWSILNSVTADSYNKLEVRGDELRLIKTQTDFDIGRMRVRLDNLFDGDKLLGDTVNGFLNEQSQEIIREIKPRFAKEIDSIILSVFGRALSRFPIEKWMSAISEENISY